MPLSLHTMLPRPPRRESFRPAPLTVPVRHRRDRYTAAYKKALREKLTFAGLIIGSSLAIVAVAALLLAAFTFAGGIVFAVLVGGVIVAAGCFQVVALFNDDEVSE